MNEMLKALMDVSVLDKFLIILIFIGIYFGKEWLDKKRNKDVACNDGINCSNEHCSDHKQLTKDVTKVKEDVGEIKVSCAETKTNIEWIKNKICD